MAEYGKLLSRIWSDPEFTKLDARSQQLYALLISYSTRNLAGVLPMTLKRWAGCTADSTTDTVTAGIKNLAAHRFVVVDWDTEELLIRTYIRNDEVYKQPNLMQATRKFCRQVESISLKFALFDELTKLPEHKNQDQTLEVANALIEGLDRPPDEPIAEPFVEGFAEPMPDGSGVGGYLSNQEEHQHLHPSPTPPPQPERSETGGRAVLVPLRKTGADTARTRITTTPVLASVSARQIAHAYNDSLGTPLVAKVLGEISTVIDECLRSDIPPHAIAAGIEEWTRSDSWSPSQIPKFVHKAANRNRPTSGIGKPSQAALSYEDAANALLAEMSTR